MKFGHWPFPLDLSRIARLLRRLVKASDGVETVEFALVSIALFMFLLGVVEFGRLYWTQSELQYAAEAGARCATVNCCAGAPASCGGSTGTTGIQKFTAGQLLGMSVLSSSLSTFQVSAQTCGNQVTFNYTFNFIVTSLLPQSAITLATTACHQA
jgi:Flp pilus assembly protein TadG